MAFCTSCGAEIKEGNAFCTSCGTKVDGATPAAGAGVNAAAGSVADQRTVAFAAGAGGTKQMPVQQAAPMNAGVPAAGVPEKKSGNAKKIVAIAIIVLAIVAVATVVVLTLMNNESSKPAQTTNTTTQQQAANESEAADTAAQEELDAAELAAEQAASEYVIPNSNTVYLTEADLANLTDYELYLARNEIFARYGRGFKNQDLANYFGSKSWYKQKYGPAEFDAMASPLNDYERKNSDLIREVEKKRNSPYQV